MRLFHRVAKIAEQLRAEAKRQMPGGSIAPLLNVSATDLEHIATKMQAQDNKQQGHYHKALSDAQRGILRLKGKLDRLAFALSIQRLNYLQRI